MSYKSVLKSESVLWVFAPDNFHDCFNYLMANNIRFDHGMGYFEGNFEQVVVIRDKDFTWKFVSQFASNQDSFLRLSQPNRDGRRFADIVYNKAKKSDEHIGYWRPRLTREAIKYGAYTVIDGQYYVASA